MEMKGYTYMVKKKTKRVMKPKLKNDKGGVAIRSSGSGGVSILLHDLRTSCVMSRFSIVVLLLLALPSIGSVISKPSHGKDESKLGSLVEKGILKEGDEGLVMATSGVAKGSLVERDFDILNQTGIKFRFLAEPFVIYKENAKISIEALDFVFLNNLEDISAVDRVVKLGGVVISQLETNKQFLLHLPANYVVVVYLRPLEHTMVVLRKISHSPSMNDGLKKKTHQGRSRCKITHEARKTTLAGLEEAMLEPPSRKMWKKLSRKMKFLPDLLKDSLESYTKRIFFSDGDKGVIEWFKKNYPTNGQKFEVYDMDVVTKEARNEKSSRAGLLSDWLRKHVKTEDYVVMKAEARLVEDMIKENTICLVDELFLECKNQWGDEEEDGEEQGSNKRSYWQCLSLYGTLRDEGVAVHQWWS